MDMSREPHGPGSRWAAYLVLSITIAALLVRIAIMVSDGSLWKPIVADELQFNGLAESLASGQGFSLDGNSIINRMPGYPSLLAVLYLVTGPSIVWAHLLNSVLGALCVPPAYQIGRRIWGWRVGLVGCGVLAVDPFSVFWPQFLLSENLQMLLVTLLGALLIAREQTVFRAQLIGLVAALSILTHPGTVPIVAAALLWYVAYRWGKQFPWRHFAFLVASLLLVLSFWTVRNWLLVGSFVPLTAGVEASGGGFVFWISNNTLTAQPGEYWGGFIPAKEYSKLPDFAEYEKLPTNDPVLQDHKGYELGLRFLTSHVDQVPMLLLGKQLKFWEPKLIMRSGEWPEPLLGIIVLLPFLIGLVAHWRKGIEGRMVLAFLAGDLLLSLIYWGGARFRPAVEAYLALTFAVGLVQIVSWVRRINRGRSSVSEVLEPVRSDASA
jgi:hypothetical protein